MFFLFLSLAPFCLVKGRTLYQHGKSINRAELQQNTIKKLCSSRAKVCKKYDLICQKYFFSEIRQPPSPKTNSYPWATLFEPRKAQSNALLKSLGSRHILFFTAAVIEKLQLVLHFPMTSSMTSVGNAHGGNLPQVWTYNSEGPSSRGYLAHKDVPSEQVPVCSASWTKTIVFSMRFSLQDFWMQCKII